MTTEKQIAETVDASVVIVMNLSSVKHWTLKDDGLKRRSVTSLLVTQHKMEQDCPGG
jgi:hypothetical protein